jgi:hypothetical protein
LIRWFSRYCITDAKVDDALANDPGQIGAIGLDLVNPIEMPSVSLNSEVHHEPLKSPHVAKHMDYLETGDILSQIEDCFRPATDPVDLIALKSVMGADFRKEMIEEV